MSMTNVLIIRKPANPTEKDEEMVKAALADYELGKPVVITNDMDATVVPGPNHVAYGYTGYYWPVTPQGAGGYGY